MSNYLLFFGGLALIAISVLIIKPIAKNLPQFGFLEFLLGSFALSLLSSGVKMLWSLFFIP
ncbi:MAG: hypothetical protein AUK48_02140 [Oscillatoriales cyanobacterium CG2_30_44_21]|nr:MAG: hypothetical protein AUK48_02140 [Oscillatoriales cyanobacterium CG2_30_44_21]